MFAKPGVQAQGNFHFTGNSFFEYDGPTLEGTPHGQGTLRFQDGSSLAGTFVRGRLDGQGIRRWQNGSFNCGSFQQGEYHGRGRLVDAAKGVVNLLWSFPPLATF